MSCTSLVNRLQQPLWLLRLSEPLVWLPLSCIVVFPVLPGQHRVTLPGHTVMSRGAWNSLPGLLFSGLAVGRTQRPGVPGPSSLLRLLPHPQSSAVSRLSVASSPSLCPSRAFPVCPALPGALLGISHLALRGGRRPVLQRRERRPRELGQRQRRGRPRASSHRRAGRQHFTKLGLLEGQSVPPLPPHPNSSGGGWVPAAPKGDPAGSRHPGAFG